MDNLITANGLCKDYRKVRALNDVNLTIRRGRIVGLIGPNGAGKTTFLKAIMGLLHYNGSLSVLGRDPQRDRPGVMEHLSYISDVAVIPEWIKVKQLVDYCEAVHPNFSRSRALDLLAKTDVNLGHKVSSLSKGMKTQLHLALVMAVHAELLVLDEPTLGLDILYRKQFYSQLLNDYFDDERTIIISTHQVEEVEHILTDLVFIKRGEIVLDISMEDLSEKFHELKAEPQNVDAARALKPLSEQTLFGQHVFLFEDKNADELSKLGDIRTPGISDLFVAKMTGGTV
jgi:ABC-2 type transport system ATP-binding protein